MNNECKEIDENLEIYNSRSYSLDERILYLLSEKIKNKLFDRTMPVFSLINNYGCVYIAIALFSMLSSRQGHVWAYIITAMALGSILGEGIIKHIVKRCRPLYSYRHRFLIKIPPSYSFPSGHTTSSFAVLGVLWNLDSGYKYLVLALALLISFSRVYLHVHYPSDIIAGIILGLVCSKLTVMAVDRMMLFHRLSLVVKAISST